MTTMTLPAQTELGIYDRLSAEGVIPASDIKVVVEEGLAKVEFTIESDLVGAAASVLFRFVPHAMLNASPLVSAPHISEYARIFFAFRTAGSVA